MAAARTAPVISPTVSATVSSVASLMSLNPWTRRIACQQGEPAERDRAHGEGEEPGQDRHAARREIAELFKYSGGERQGRGRDERRSGRSGLPLLRHDEGVRQDEFLNPPGEVDQQQHPGHVPHPRVECQGKADGERDPGHRDQPVRQRMPRRHGLRQGLEPDPGQLGRDDQPPRPAGRA